MRVLVKLAGLFFLSVGAVFAAPAAVPTAPQQGLPSSTVPYDEFSELWFHNVEVNQTYYPQTYPTIRDVDFKSLTVYLSEEGNKFTGYPLKNGSWDYRSRWGYDAVGLEDIYYLPQNDSGTEYALVRFYRMSCGATCGVNEGFALLFELDNRQLRIVQQFDWGNVSKFNPETKSTPSFNPFRNIFVVQTPHAMPGEGGSSCCISAMDVITLEWNGNRFIPTSLETELTDYGREAGKTLHP